MFELLITVPAWIADKGNNTWWNHMGGIHPAMPGSPLPSLKILGEWANGPQQSQEKAKSSSSGSLQCPM
jgi:hypothetical protein